MGGGRGRRERERLAVERKLEYHLQDSNPQSSQLNKNRTLLQFPVLIDTPTKNNFRKREQKKIKEGENKRSE